MSSKKRGTDDPDDGEGWTAKTKELKVLEGNFASKMPVRNPGFVRLKETLYHMGNTKVMEHFEPFFTNNKRLPKSEDLKPGEHPHFVQSSIVDLRWKLAELRDLYARPKGDVIAFGMEDTYQLGLVELVDADKDNGFPPTLLKDLEGKGMIQVAAGGLHSVGLDESGVAYSWGCCDDGALGRIAKTSFDQVSPTEITKMHPSKHAVSAHSVRSPKNESSDVIAIDAGVSHSIFLTISGNVYTTGLYSDGDGGKLCDIRPPDCPVASDDHPRGSVVGMHLEPVHIYQLPGRAKFVAAGGSICAAILEDGSLFTWGMGINGQLARSANMTTIVDKDGYPELGKAFYMMEDKVFNQDVIKEHFLKPKPVIWSSSLPSIKRVVTHVACGSYHTLVVARAPEDSSSRAYSAGGGAYGKLGHGDEFPRHELTLIEGLKDVPIVRVAAGQEHSLFLHPKGNAIYACGHNGYKQCGVQNENLMTRPTSEATQGMDESKKDPMLLKPARVALPIVEHLDVVGRIVDIAVGESHSLAVTSGGKLFTWGYGDYGAVGIDPRVSTDDIHPRLSHDWLPNTDVFVHQASGGAQHSLVIATRYSK